MADYMNPRLPPDAAKDILEALHRLTFEPFCPLCGYLKESSLHTYYCEVEKQKHEECCGCSGKAEKVCADNPDLRPTYCKLSVNSIGPLSEEDAIRINGLGVGW